MRLGRRRRFADLVQRQLDLFERDSGEELTEVAAARDRWRRASRETAEEAFGDERDRVDWTAESLSAICDSYAATLPDIATQDAYRRAFTRAVHKRFRDLSDAFEEQTDTGEEL